MIGHEFPYLDTRDLNLDWLLKNMKQILQDWATYQQNMNQNFANLEAAVNQFESDMTTAFNNLHNFVDDYFDNLDVQQEINNKINAMTASGELIEIMSPVIANETTTWLSTHITNPSNPPIDTSLSVAGAAADAKKTGDEIKQLRSDMNIISPIDDSITWMQGSYNGTGGVVASNYAISTDWLNFAIGDEIYITPVGNIKYMLTEWDAQGASYAKTTGNVTAAASYTIEHPYQKITFYVNTSPTPEITPDDSDLISIMADYSAKIQSAISNNNEVRFKEGNFFISSAIELPAGKKIIGAGFKTIIHSNDDNCIILSGDNIVENLKIIGTNTSKPATVGAQDGIVVNGENNIINNIFFEGISGKAITALNTHGTYFYNNTITNCKFRYCGVGVDLGVRIELYVVNSCSFEYCYKCVICIGGNNNICNCFFMQSGLAIDMVSDSTTNNNGHSIINDNTIIHNDAGITADNIINGMLFNDNSIFYSPITIENSRGFLFNGCMFGYDMSIIATDSLGVRISNSIFTTRYTVSGVTLNDCTKTDGTPAN